MEYRILNNASNDDIIRHKMNCAYHNMPYITVDYKKVYAYIEVRYCDKMIEIVPYLKSKKSIKEVKIKDDVLYVKIMRNLAKHIAPEIYYWR